MCVASDDNCSERRAGGSTPSLKGEIVVRSVRSADPLKYELVLTVQAPSGALVEVVVRCLREAHFDTVGQASVTRWG